MTLVVKAKKQLEPKNLTDLISEIEKCAAGKTILEGIERAIAYGKDFGEQLKAKEKGRTDQEFYMLYGITSLLNQIILLKYSRGEYKKTIPLAAAAYGMYSNESRFKNVQASLLAEGLLGLNLEASVEREILVCVNKLLKKVIEYPCNGTDDRYVKDVEMYFRTCIELKLYNDLINAINRGYSLDTPILALFQDKLSAGALVNLGTAYAYSRHDLTPDLAAAEKYFLMARDLEPENTLHLANLAQIYAMKKQYHIALGYLREAFDKAKQLEIQKLVYQGAEIKLSIEEGILAGAYTDLIGMPEFKEVAGYFFVDMNPAKLGKGIMIRKEYYDVFSRMLEQRVLEKAGKG